MSIAILVEGPGDQDFINSLLKKLGINNVTSFPPSRLSGLGNGISNVIKNIPVLVRELSAGTYASAGILVDADYAGINGGFVSRRQEITDELLANGYSIDGSFAGIGDRFLDGASSLPIGLYVLPDHSNDGMLEDLIKTMVTSTDQVSLLSQACIAVSGVTPKLFRTDIHQSKAEVNTFLAWQKKPPAYFGTLVEENHLDETVPSCGEIIRWINSL